VNLVADENVDRQIVSSLRDDGHQVWYAAEMISGSSDEHVLELANLNSALVLTGDKDFGELVYRRRLVHHGVVLIRLAGLSSSEKTRVVTSVFRQRGSELREAFSVISYDKVRIRHSHISNR
jgi:predicted nuclease of predicted toxin-antitoxin system